MSGGKNETVTTVKLSPEQKEFVKAVMPSLLQFVRQPPQLGPQVVRGPSAAEQTAFSIAPAVAGSQLESGVAANEALARLSSLASAPIGRELEAVIAPLERRLTEDVLPSIRSKAVATGQLGSSRQALAEGVASREIARAMFEAALESAARERSQNIEAALRAAALGREGAPGALQTLLATGAAERGIGEAQRAEEASRLLYEQSAPVLAAQEAAQVVFGVPLASAVARGPGASTNPVAGALGGAIAGYALTQMIPSLAGFGPYGALAGLAIGLGASLFD